MQAEVIANSNVILVDVTRRETCCLTLEPHEALDLAQQLLAAAVEVSTPARFDPKLVKPWQGLRVPKRGVESLANDLGKTADHSEKTM